MTGSQLPLLRLLQVADSSFPTGGFAYSHGLEWLAKQGTLREADLGDLLSAYVSQVAAGQWLPAALTAARARSAAALVRADQALDASITPGAERDAGRAMGERLLVGALDALRGQAEEGDDGARPGPARLLVAVRERQSPGQYAVAFGCIARACGVAEDSMLAALGFAMVTSVVQAAVRLNLIGQAAAGRLVARACTNLDPYLGRTLAAGPRRSFGAFAPGLEVAALLQPTLPFRMFAS